MSVGTNKLINSENTVRGNSQSTLKSKLVNANTVAKGIKSIPVKNKKK